MATIKFRLRRTQKDTAPISIYLSMGRGKVYERSTGFSLKKSDWSKSTGYPKQNVAENKKLAKELKKLQDEILNRVNDSQVTGEPITSDWLQDELDIYFGKKTRSGHKDTVVYWIDWIVKNADTRDNGKGGIGIGKSRIGQYKRLKELFGEFQGRKQYRIKDVNEALGKEFVRFMSQTMDFSLGYTRKMVANLKSVCKEAETYGTETSPEYRKIKSTGTKNDYIIVLSPQELQKIAEADMPNRHLENARRWLLFGCWVGQRGGDLIKITEGDFRQGEGYKYFELRQQKGNKPIRVRLLPQAMGAIKDGFPYKIATQNLNDYIKDVCRIAKINEPTEGSLKNPDTNRDEIGTYPKWKLITTHVCRRSFCTNLYGKLSTPAIMQVTGHKREDTFLRYIGKSGLNFDKEWDAWEKQQKEK